MFEIRSLATVGEIARCQRLRYEVWSGEGVRLSDPSLETIADSHDDHAMHWGVFDGSRLVGAARLCLHTILSEAPDAELFTGLEIPAPFASMNRLVVVKNHRGRGIASQLDQIRIRQGKELGARAIIVAPATKAKNRRRSLEAQGFLFRLERLGCAVWSPTVEICPCYLRLDSMEEAALDDPL